MRTLIDGDILRYELGAVAQDVEEVFGVKAFKPWPKHRVVELVENRIETIIRGTEAESFEVFLSQGSNYRFDIAKTDPYKGQRKGDKPQHWGTIGEILQELFDAYSVHGAEADDVLSIYARLDPENTVIASRDKDLRIVPCWHYAWKSGASQPEVTLHKVEALGELYIERYGSGGIKLKGNGLKFFYGQVLVGDSVDNYKGCPRVGPARAFEVLSACSDEAELWEATYWEYAKKLGPEDGLKRLIENAQLAWLLEDAEIEEKDHDLYVSPKRLWQPPASIPVSFE